MDAGEPLWSIQDPGTRVPGRGKVQETGRHGFLVPAAHSGALDTYPNWVFGVEQGNNQVIGLLEAFDAALQNLDTTLIEWHARLPIAQNIGGGTIGAQGGLLARA